MSIKKVLFLLILFNANLILAENQYYESCPVIIKETELKRYPYNDINFNMFKVSKDYKFSIKNKTLDSSGNVWYYGSLLKGENKYNHGWIIGSSISFLEGYDENYWNSSSFKIKNVSFKHVNIDLQIENVLTNLFNIDWSHRKSSNILDEDLPLNVSLDTLTEGEFVESFESHIWYMKESNYVINSYQFDWGLLYAFVNKDLHLWRLLQLKLNKKITGSDIYVGMSVNELEEKLGTNYILEDNKLEYHYLFNANFYINFIIEDNIIKQINISLHYS